MAKPAAPVAWITGGGRGIGRACAIALVATGHRVAVSARSGQELSATAKLAGKGTRAIPCDVTRAQDVEHAYDEVVSQLGRPSVLVNAAGMARSAAFHRTDEAFMQQHWDLNVLGPFRTMKACLPAMVEAGHGRIINIASIAAKVGHPYVAAYTASKHALLGLTRSVAAEVASKAVTVNAVCPGYVDTQMTKDNVAIIVEKTGMRRQEALARITSMNPQGRLVQPGEVAAVVAFLCTAEAASITGQAINVDGGAVQ